ncbi:YaeQ family protein [Geobacter sp.]|uniref:YaeQ family protein n=1 Tax=Geobacter sp. TaxID=46610 RepID=UPI0027BA911A|nr:YaeQ family protein [Geobacter sp.]
MALPSTIHRATIQLSHVDRGIYETFQTTLARHPSETAERLVLRLLAYAICYEPDLTFTKGICAGDEPDLWSRGPDGRVSLWIEVGTPEPERLLKASRHAGRTVLLASGPSRFRWDEQYRAKLADVPNLVVLGIDFAFVSQVAAGLERSIAWDLTITGGTIYLTSAGKTLECALEVLKGQLSSWQISGTP